MICTRSRVPICRKRTICTYACPNPPTCTAQGKEGWYSPENIKFGSRYYADVSVERPHSCIKTPACISFPVSYCIKCPVLSGTVQDLRREDHDLCKARSIRGHQCVLPVSGLKAKHRCGLRRISEDTAESPAAKNHCPTVTTANSRQLVTVQIFASQASSSAVYCRRRALREIGTIIPAQA